MFRFGWSFLLKTPSLKLERCEAWLAAEAFESAPGPSPSIRIRDPVVPSWIQGAAYFRIAVERLPPGAESRFSPRSAARICGKACRAATSPAATMSGVLVKRSEERRVGKECRARWAPYDRKINSNESAERARA